MCRTASRPGLRRSRTTNGRWITSHVINQDFVAWVGQGTIADRTREHLGSSDRGIAMMRKQLFDDLNAIAAGRDPLGSSAIPGAPSACLRPLPCPALHRGDDAEAVAGAPFFSQRLKDFRWHAGQPTSVWNEYIEVMGFPERKR